VWTVLTQNWLFGIEQNAGEFVSNHKTFW